MPSVAERELQRMIAENKRIEANAKKQMEQVYRTGRALIARRPQAGGVNVYSPQYIEWTRQIQRGMQEQVRGIEARSIYAIEQNTLRHVSFASTFTIQDLANQAIGEASLQLNEVIQDFAGNSKRLINRKVGLERDMQIVATEARDAVLQSYVRLVKPKANRGYRPQSRLTGKMLDALQRPDFIVASSTGIAFGNEQALDDAAAHWRRLNYGTEGGISQKSAPSFPLRLGGETIGSLQDRNTLSPAFTMPEGFFFDVSTGKGVPFGRKSGSHGFAPRVATTRAVGAALSRKSAEDRAAIFKEANAARKRKPSKGIRGYRFFDAGIEVIAENMPKVVERRAFAWFEEAATGVKAKQAKRAFSVRDL